jgi:hypothetical protein
MLGRRARLAGDRVGHAVGSAAAGGGHEAAGRARRLPAPAPHLQRRQRLPPRLGEARTARGDIRASLDRGARVGASRRVAGRRGSREHPRRRGHPRRADERCRAGVSRRRVAPPSTGDPLGAVLVWDAVARPGRRNDAARVRGLRLRLVPDRLERSAGAHLAACATLRRGRGSPDRRGRHGPGGVRGRPAHGRRRRHRQHAGRRVLCLPGGDVGRGNDRLHRVPGAAERSRAEGRPPPLLGGPDRRRGPPRAKKTSCSRRSTPTRAPAGSASSGSAATPASTATCGTSTSTRR